MVTGPVYRKTDLLDITGITNPMYKRWRRAGLIPLAIGHSRWAYYVTEHVERIRAIVAAKDANMTHRDLFDRFHPPTDDM